MTDTIGARQDNVGRGIALALIAILVFTTQDAASKAIVESGVSVFQMTMMRFWAFGAFALLLAWRQGGIANSFRTRRPVLQLLRGVLLIADIWLFATALGMVPLAAVHSIILIYPLMVTLFAIPLLGEKVGWFRFGAVATGFAGAMIIVRPGGVPLDWGVAYAVASCACYALYLVLTRKVSATDSTTTSMVYTGVIGLMLSSAVGVFYWEPLEPRALMLIIYIMITGVVAHGMMIYALSMAPASVLQPFSYTALPWAIVFSVWIFHEPLDPLSLVGAGVIIVAGMVVMARERVKRVEPVSVEPPLPGRE